MLPLCRKRLDIFLWYFEPGLDDNSRRDDRLVGVIVYLAGVHSTLVAPVLERSGPFRTRSQTMLDWTEVIGGCDQEVFVVNLWNSAVREQHC
jgi:hypothetical protein